MVISLVLVERSDDVVAVGVGKRKALEADGAPAMGVGVTGEIEPVPPPAFTVGW